MGVLDMSKKNNTIELDTSEHISFNITVPDAPEVTISINVIPFGIWFDGKLKSYKVKAHQKAALLTFFKKQGLSALENPDKYEEAFKKF